MTILVNTSKMSDPTKSVIMTWLSRGLLVKIQVKEEKLCFLTSVELRSIFASIFSEMTKRGILILCSAFLYAVNASYIAHKYWRTYWLILGTIGIVCRQMVCYIHAWTFVRGAYTADATAVVGERCTSWLIFLIFALKVLLFDVLSCTWSYKIE